MGKTKKDSEKESIIPEALENEPIPNPLENEPVPNPFEYEPIRPVTFETEDNSMFAEGIKSIQEIEKMMATNALTFAMAVEKGLITYLSERKKSEEEKKNGPIQDMFVNAARGFSETVKEASPIISDTAETFDRVVFSEERRKRMRRAIDRLFFPFRS